jgi:hypothetical protein
MKRTAVLVCMMVLCASAVQAGPLGKAHKARADRNKDGYVDQKERQLDRKLEKTVQWEHGKARVNNEIEKKYDLNGDGWLQPAEIKELTKDKYQLIQTHGKAKVDTAVEKKYDGNQDGILDATEAKKMFDESQE